MTRILLILLLAVNAFAATRYVDVGKTGSGSNNGTDWDNAYTNWASAKPNVSAGDTVWLSKGVYREKLDINSAGTAGSPIYIGVSREAGHIGKVMFTNSTADDGALLRDYVTLDGAGDTNYYLTHMTNTWSVTNMATNINLILVGAYAINSSGMEGSKIKWVELSTATLDSSSYSAIWIQDTDPDDIEISYCWMHNCRGDGVLHTQNDSSELHDVTVHHCLIENVGDDGVNTSGTGGFTIHHCIIRDTLDLSGHADGVENPGMNQVWYNNVIYDWDTVPSYPGPHSQVAESNSWIYGNLIYHEDIANDMDAGISWAVDAAWPNGQDGTFSDVFICNNTVISDETMWLTLAFQNRQKHTGATVTNKNVIIKNNILLGNWDNAGSYAIGLPRMQNYEGTDYLAFEYNTNDVLLDYNVLSANNTYGFRIGYFNSNFAHAVEMAQYTMYDNNRTNYPTFVNAAAFNFQLSSNDTAAKNYGTNLSYLNLPGLTNDLWGYPRGLGGVWDIGASEYPESGYITNGLLCWLRFEDDFSDWVLEDSSTNNADMLKYGFKFVDTNWWQSSSNWPTAQAGSLGGTSAAFVGYWTNVDLLGEGFHDGQYGAITNLTGGLLNMTNFTLCLWVKASNYAIASGWEHNASIIDGGSSTNGSWRLTRDSTEYFEFILITNAPDANNGLIVEFPIGGTNYGHTNWQHYGVTVTCADSNITMVGYYQGSPFTNISVTITNPATRAGFATVGPTGDSDYPNWIAVGVNSHVVGNNETPPLNDGDGFPNNGWFHGRLDDIRIYNRALTSNEISQIYSGTETGGGSESGGGSTNTVKKVGIRGRSTTRGNVRIR